MGDFVVRQNETSNLYLRNNRMEDVDPVNFSDNPEEWQEFETLEDAQAKAMQINAGTVGTIRPQV